MQAVFHSGGCDSELGSIALQHCYPVHCCCCLSHWPTEKRRKRQYLDEENGQQTESRGNNNKNPTAAALADSNKRNSSFRRRLTCLFSIDTRPSTPRRVFLRFDRVPFFFNIKVFTSWSYRLDTMTTQHDLYRQFFFFLQACCHRNFIYQRFSLFFSKKRLTKCCWAPIKSWGDECRKKRRKRTTHKMIHMIRNSSLSRNQWNDCGRSTAAAVREHRSSSTDNVPINAADELTTGRTDQ